MLLNSAEKNVYLISQYLVRNFSKKIKKIKNQSKILLPEISRNFPKVEEYYYFCLFFSTGKIPVKPI
jgi:hypothetical protein